MSDLIDERTGEQIGWNNRLKAWYRRLPRMQQAAITVGLQVFVSLLLWLVDPSLGYLGLTAAAIWWLWRLPLYYRLAGEAALVVIFAFSHVRSFAFVLAAAFGVAWLREFVPQRYKGWVVTVAVVAAAVLYPFYVPKMFTIPVFGAWPDVATAVYMLVFIMMAIGLNIVVGYAGLLDLGYVAFYAMGAYTAAWFASQQFSGEKCPKAGVSVSDCPVQTVPVHSLNLWGIGVPPGTGGYHISIWIVLLLAGILTALTGILIGLPTLRLRGDYLAIVTLGFGEIVAQVAKNSDNLFGTGFNLTNGPNGITPLDPPGFGHSISNATGGVLPANYLQCCTRTMLGHAIQSTDVYYWTAIVLVLITVFCSFRLQFSRLGRAWIAIREDETAAAAMGIPLMRTKTWAYASGAFFGGVAGAYYAAFKSATFPGDFFFNISVFILCMVILGGMGNIWGVIVGAGFLAYLNQAGLANTGSWINSNIHFGGWHPNLDVPLYASGIYGVIILVVMLFRPEGLIPSRRVAAELHEGVHDTPLYDSEHAGLEPL